MANKKKVADFESALMNNTKVLNKSSEPKNETSKNELIETKVLQKYKALAQEQGIETKDLINLALEHFINMKDVLFKD